MEIEELLARVDSELAKEDAYPFLTDIRKSLEQLKDTEATSEGDRSRMASGLERLVLEDFRFSESELGGKLLAFSDAYVKNGLP